MNTTNFLTTLFLLLVLACNDDETNSAENLLPPITTTGENTFGCLIDGEYFRPRDGITSNDKGVFFWAGGESAPNWSYNEIDVVDLKSEHTAKLLIHIQDLAQNEEGDYTINESNGLDNIDSPAHTNMYCRIWREEYQHYEYYLSYDNSGMVEILKYDLPNRIVSGTFSGKLISYNYPNDTIEVTQGRFDFKWDKLHNKIWP